ncbi:MAG: N-acetylglutaminylglutamine amidotransferase [Zoogloeaceae bacterium]|jgi:asparagine synthase (glutamine-hydrolysing)|nr:N-acetylglutaminylglutamine amidotransferase [Zoogloeaceae bacterium]
MCGICGELRFDGQAADGEALGRMTCALRQRGPDAGGQFIDGALAFGHRRLSIIDLSEAASQPMQDDELGLALVFNGVIYNYRELRLELAARGYRFFSEGDTEVILKAYHAWGRDCLARLDGMFAFAIWDRSARRLFLARDRFGIKPLYLVCDAQRLRFASSLPALLAGGGVERELDAIGLQFQFTLHGSVPAPYTIFRHVKKLPPASWRAVAADGVTLEGRYWRLSARRPAPEPDADAYLEAARERLEAAVESHLLAADVPVGVLLSGGLDSSLLVALLAARGRTNIPTFSIGFADQPEEAGNEFYYSDIVARHFGTAHHRCHISDREMLAALPEAIAAMSEPMFSQDNVAFWLLAREVRKEVKAVLSGQGADEAFGGYYWYPQMAAEPETLPPLARFAPRYFDRPHAEFLEMLDPQWVAAHADAARDHVAPFINARLREADADSFMDQVFSLDVTTLIVDDPVKRIDNMSMAHGLEARVPFLDKTLVETAMTLPPALRLAEGGKFPLKRLARDLLPHAIIDRPKGYFPTPALKYLRGGFLEFIRDTLTASACRNRGLYNRAYVDRLLAEPLQHFTPLQGNKLWHLAAFEYWMQIHAPAPTKPSPAAAF